MQQPVDGGLLANPPPACREQTAYLPGKRRVSHEFTVRARPILERPTVDVAS